MVSCQSALICFDNRHLVMYSSSHKTHLEEPHHPWSIPTIIYTLNSLLRFFNFLYQLSDLYSSLFYFLFFIYLFTPLQYPTHLHSAYLHCILPYFIFYTSYLQFSSRQQARWLSLLACDRLSGPTVPLSSVPHPLRGKNLTVHTTHPPTPPLIPPPHPPPPQLTTLACHPSLPPSRVQW